MFPSNIGDVCAFLAFWGMISMSSTYSDVACILIPSVCVAFNPVFICISNLYGLSIHTKCVVLPLLTITYVGFDGFNGVCILV